jgi:CHAT domain
MNMRRALVAVEPVSPEGWSVEVTLPSGMRLPARAMPAIGTPPTLFPLPPPEYVLLEPMDAHFDLCRGTQDDIQAVLTRLVARDPNPTDVEAFGRYLFSSLLGEYAWREILCSAESEAVEVALSWADSELALSRLPWELMHDGKDLLVAKSDQRVGITRVVRGAQATLDEIPAPFRVLFVVGTTLRRTEIRPGAEYFGLLRRLQAKGITFSSRVLTEAKPQSIVDALLEHPTTVVHFICHGRFDQGEAVLELIPDLPTQGQIDPVDADRLLQIMKAPGVSLPQVVVLNACHSGGVPVGQEAAPLATRLVQGGIPVVVGMSGQVADHACRLFTRRFYEALLQGESIAAAASEGRLAGLLGADPKQRVDWAFPTMFLAEQASPEVRVDPDGMKLAKRLATVAMQIQTVHNPKVFCDRFEFVEDAYHELMRPPDSTGKRVLGVRVSHAESGNDRYGKTRLLEELAAQAASDGHVPCLLRVVRGDDPPTTLSQLALALLNAILTSRDWLDAAGFHVSRTPTSKVFNILNAVFRPPRLSAHLDPLSLYYMRLDALAERLRLPGRPPPVARNLLLDALRSDFEALTREVSGELPDARVLVLIDEVHRFDTAAQELIQLLGPGGLGLPGAPVPVVFTFTMSTDPQTATAVGELKSFMESGRSLLEPLDLKPLPHPNEDPLPYHQFLLYGPDTPLVVKSDSDPEQLSVFYDLLHDSVRGVPSQLEWPTKEVEACVQSALRLARFLEEADDEAMLAKVR